MFSVTQYQHFIFHSVTITSLQPTYNLPPSLPTPSLKPTYNLLTTYLQSPYNLPTTFLHPTYNLPTTALPVASLTFYNLLTHQPPTASYFLFFFFSSVPSLSQLSTNSQPYIHSLLESQLEIHILPKTSNNLSFSPSANNLTLTLQKIHSFLHSLPHLHFTICISHDSRL